MRVPPTRIPARNPVGGETPATGPAAPARASPIPTHAPGSLPGVSPSDLLPATGQGED